MTPTDANQTLAQRQHDALAKLVVLSNQCAEQEQRIEQHHADTQHKWATHHDTLKQVIQDRYDTVRRRTRREIDARVAELKEQLDAQSQQLTKRGKTQLEDLDARLGQTEEKAREDVQHARWTADSVLEGIQNKLKQQKQETIKQVEGYGQSIEALVQRCQARLTRTGMGGMEIPQPAAGSEVPEDQDPGPMYLQRVAEAEQALVRVERLPIPGMLTGVKPIFVGGMFATLAGIIAHIATGTETPNWPVIIGAVVGAGILFVPVAWGLHRVGRRQTAAALEPLARHLAQARAEADAVLAYAARCRKETREAAIADRQATLDKIEQDVVPRLEQLAQRNREKLERGRAEVQAALDQTRSGLTGQIDTLMAERERFVTANKTKQKRLFDMEAQRRADRIAANDARRTGDLDALESRWRDGREQIESLIQNLSSVNDELFPPWEDPSWDTWSPPTQFAQVVRFGQLQVEMAQIMTDLARGGRFKLGLDESFAVPALLSAPDQRSMLIQAGGGGREGRDRATDALRAVMLRLLTAMPPGRVRFTLFDPVGLGQSFAGFMHLADYDDQLVTSRIWSEPQHLTARLTDLTEHMENVIQKYLRNDFETIDEYNAQAGELAEPYRFLVVTDFPTGFSAEAIARLSSIAASGARCGVFLLIFHDTRQPLPSGTHLEDLEANCVVVCQRDGRWVWKDELYERFPLTLDPLPGEDRLTSIVQRVGEGAKDASRVEVPFELIAPADGEVWSRTTDDVLAVPVGRTGATRLQSISLGQGVAQHALVAGKTGSGKSTLLHVLITNLALWHHPDQVEFYLIDFKKGVEFKAYANIGLPHARAIAIESDREFGLSVLQRIDAELERRGELFRQAGVQNLAQYRALPDAVPMPRTLLLIDEFHEFFSEDDKIAQDAALLLDRLVRQGRAFGVHALLGSQSIGGALGLGRGTLGQMAVRIALQCSEADSQLILNDDNAAARLLSRPGEAIYNDQGGALEGNSPFQISWIPDAERDQRLRAVAERARRDQVRHAPTIVFEGNAPADLRNNAPLQRLLDAEDWPASDTPGAPAAPRAWIGEPVAIKDPTAITLRRQAGANALIIGQQDEAALAMLGSAMITIAAQADPAAVRFVVFDGSTADSPMHGRLEQFADAVPHDTRVVPWRDTDEAIDALSGEMHRRLDDPDHALSQPAVVVLMYGLQRYRSLRKSEDDFSFSMSDDDAPAAPKPDKQFAELLREGPTVGIHVLTWCDTPVNVERTVDRALMREFDTRILFQMSATDSSNLVDSPAANSLGLYRALAYSEEQGVMEKFRPYALPDAALLDRVRQAFAARPVPDAAAG